MSNEIFSFTVSRGVLDMIIAVASQFSDSGKTGVGFMKATHFSVADGEMTCTARMNTCGAQYKVDIDDDSVKGEALVTSSDLVKIASVLPSDDVTISFYDDNTMELSGGGTEVSSPTLDMEYAQEKPDMRDISNDFTDIDSSSDLQDGLNWVSNFKTKGDGSSSNALSGVLFTRNTDSWSMMCGSVYGISLFTRSTENGGSDESVMTVLPVDSLHTIASQAANSENVELAVAKEGITVKVDGGSGELVMFASALNVRPTDFGAERLVKQAEAMLSGSRGESQLSGKHFSAVLSNAVKMSDDNIVSLSFDSTGIDISSIGGYGYQSAVNATSTVQPGSPINVKVDGVSMRGASNKCQNVVMNIGSEMGDKVPLIISQEPVSGKLGNETFSVIVSSVG